ncbi:hypothetical protein P12x_002895 [Tundrisphaera lichenicola]|uniref:hypothetical protein n=1 Tax=Tundrisphaera lichenicola TaxID=2029860 RepID=UPI003EC1074E
MRRFLIPVLLVLSIVAGFSLARGPDAQVQPAKSASIWEYRVLLLTELINIQQAMKEPSKIRVAVEERYNELGRDGWEYCGNDNALVTFKRMKP